LSGSRIPAQSTPLLSLLLQVGRHDAQPAASAQNTRTSYLKDGVGDRALRVGIVLRPPSTGVHVDAPTAPSAHAS
jgi:hypothetical protein